MAEVPPTELAELRFALARGLGRDSPRGREFANLAADAYREAGAVHAGASRRPWPGRAPADDLSERPCC